MLGQSFDLFARDALGLTDYDVSKNDIFSFIVSPEDEALAYEKLYSVDKMSFKRISNALKNEYPSTIWENNYKDQNQEIEKTVNDFFMHIRQQEKFIIGVKNCAQFPTESINNYMDYPTPILYSKGNVDMLDSDFKANKYISIVGTRKITDEGYRRTKKIVKQLKDIFSNKITIVSGLARGVDTVVLSTAIENSLSVIGVIGTPINEYYPKENINLQDKIAQEHLLVSHVPFYKYKMEPFSAQRFHFTERNSIMAAISDATIIVEASETSGTRTQARDCLKHNKPLYFLKSCYNTGQEWVKNAVKNGAKILENVEDLI